MGTAQTKEGGGEDEQDGKVEEMMMKKKSDKENRKRKKQMRKKMKKKYPFHRYMWDVWEDEEEEKAKMERKMRWQQQLQRQLRFLDRNHQYEKVTFDDEQRRRFGALLRCRRCHGGLQLNTRSQSTMITSYEGYVCSVCKKIKYALCTKCFEIVSSKAAKDAAATTSTTTTTTQGLAYAYDEWPTLTLLQGCEGENGLSDEEELALVTELQQTDEEDTETGGDLAILERRPDRTFIPSAEGSLVVS